MNVPLKASEHIDGELFCCENSLYNFGFRTSPKMVWDVETKIILIVQFTAPTTLNVDSAEWEEKPWLSEGD